MRRIATIVLLALLVGAQSADAAPRCSLPGAKTVQENAEARLFYVKGRGQVKRTFFGCVRGRRPILLTANTNPKSDEDTHTQNVKFRLAGRFVAWVSTSSSDFGVGEFGRAIEVRALEAGHRRVSQDVSDYRSVGALVLREDGAVAWSLITGGAYTEVDAVDSTAREPTPLAYARGIDPASVRVDASNAFWTQDGTERSAPLG